MGQACGRESRGSGVGVRRDDGTVRLGEEEAGIRGGTSVREVRVCPEEPIVAGGRYERFGEYPTEATRLIL